MLKMIRSSVFKQKEINFHTGLNAVIGDENGANSIGKTTLLMIIDFIFGGDDYISKNSDAIEHLGNHAFEFTFEFDNVNYNFIRKTEDYGNIHICNDDFSINASLDRLDYCEWLKEKYECNIDELSFRNIVGRYIRVYGKDNLKERDPIKYFEGESDLSSINTLIKLFNKYKVLVSCENRIKDLEERKKIYTDASKKQIISIPNNQTQFNKNNSEIALLKEKASTLRTEIETQSLDYKALLSNDLLELQKSKSEITIRMNRLITRLNRAKSTIKRKKSKIIDEKDQFLEFFPEANIDKMDKIENFHSNLVFALEKEFNEVTTKIAVEVKILETELVEVNSRISKLLNIESLPTPTIDMLVNYTQRINKLEESNLKFLNEKETIKELKDARKTRHEIKVKITDEICSRINDDMAKSIRFIYSDERRIPTFNIHGNKYTFETAGDTGTGTNYSSLISFDLSLLNFTCLPILVHDLPLLKNIENDAFGKIVRLYDSFDKQIFIAIDKLKSYGNDTYDFVKKKEVIQLTKEDILFTLNWKIK